MSDGQVSNDVTKDLLKINTFLTQILFVSEPFYPIHPEEELIFNIIEDMIDHTLDRFNGITE